MEQRLDSLSSRVIHLEMQRQSHRELVREEVEKAISERGQYLLTLMTHAVKALRLLVDAGVLTQDAVNEALRG